MPRWLRAFYFFIVMLGWGCIHAADYHGSQAYQGSKPLHASVDIATGVFNFSYPVIYTKGVHAPFSLSLFYRFNASGRFGLPDGWGFDLDHVTAHTAVIGGKQWVIDNLWKDETLYASGLKYFKQHGARFNDIGISKPIPNHPNLYYRYQLQLKDGSVKYFSEQGLLIFQQDRFGNALEFAYEKPVVSVESARLTSVNDEYGNQYKFSYAPNAIRLVSPDGGEQTIYFNKDGVIKIDNPLGESTHISYETLVGRTLLTGIESPSGLVTELGYSSIFYKQSGDTKELPVVNHFKQFDKATDQTHHEANYTYSKGNNYTGYPYYSLSDIADSLIDSNNQKFVYQVAVTLSDGNADKPSMKRQVYSYNYLHLPIEVVTYKDEKPHAKTAYTYNISAFKFSRSTNYDKPETIINHVWHQGKQAFIESDKVVQNYDFFGNKLEYHHHIYDRDKGDWVPFKSEINQFYTDAYSLIKEKQVTDYFHERQTKTQFALAPSGKTHGLKTHSSKQLDETQWQPWQKEVLEHDARGRRTSHELSWLDADHPGVQSIKQQKRYHFDADSKRLCIEHESALGRVTTKEIDTRNNKLVKLIKPMGETTQFTYDLLGRLIQEQDPEGYKVKTTYTSYEGEKANTKTIQSPLGDKKRKIYDASHREIVLQDLVDGVFRNRTQHQYNAFGHVVSQQDIYGYETRFYYDELQRVIRLIDPDGNDTTFVYDDDHQLTKLYENGQKRQETQQVPWLGKTTHRVFGVKTNTLDTPSAFLEISETKGAHGQALNKTSALVKLIGGSRFEENTVDYVYDAALSKLKMHFKGYDVLEKIVAWQHDIHKNKVRSTISLTDKSQTHNHQGFAYEYDEDNKLISELSPESAKHSTPGVCYEYDRNGRKVAKTLSDGHSIQYKYDKRGAVQGLIWYRYDQPYYVSLHHDADGKLLEASDSNGKSVHYRYTQHGLLSEVIYPDKKSLVYRYDHYDRVNYLKTASGYNLTYRYSPEQKGRLSSIHYDAGASYLLYGVDDNHMHGQLVGLRHEPKHEKAISIKYHYNSLGLLGGVTADQDDRELSYELSYQYNAKADIESVRHSVKLPGQPEYKALKAYGYDSLGRLVSEHHPHKTAAKHSKPDIDYRYDGLNNLILENRVSDHQVTAIHRHYNDDNQLVSVDRGQGIIMTEHDVNGRLIKDVNGQAYAYDDQGLLMSIVSAEGKKIHYDYLPTGVLSKKRYQSEDQHFYYHPSGNIASVLKKGVWSSFMSNKNSLLATIGDGGVDYMIKGNQHTGLIMGSNGVRMMNYEGYGALQADPAHYAADDFGFGQLFNDADAGLTYMKSRFFHVSDKRFLTEDTWPVENRYAFANANPIFYADPLGHSTQQGISYGVGGGITLLGIIGAIFSIPTGGASLTLSAAAGIAAGVTTTLSGGALIGSQVALDAGHKAVGEALRYTSIGLGALAIGEGAVAVAPKVAGLVERLINYATVAREAATIAGSGVTVVPNVSDPISAQASTLSGSQVSESVTSSVADASHSSTTDILQGLSSRQPSPILQSGLEESISSADAPSILSEDTASLMDEPAVTPREIEAARGLDKLTSKGWNWVTSYAWGFDETSTEDDVFQILWQTHPERELSDSDVANLYSYPAVVNPSGVNHNMVLDTLVSYLQEGNFIGN